MTVLVTGAAGQDGVLLARKLIARGEKVVGACLLNATEYLNRAVPGIDIYPIDLSEFSSVDLMLDQIKPENIYNLAGFSSVRKSWEEPHIMTRINSELPAQILSWCARKSRGTRFLQASSSEIFGGTEIVPQNEITPMLPITPYGLSKAFAHSLTQEFRQQYGLHASTAILYNHESPLRSPEFVTRQIIQGIAHILLGQQNRLTIGNTSSQRDWGWAPDYVHGMTLALEHPNPDDYVFSTGQLRRVDDLIRVAFESVDISNYLEYLEENEALFRRVDPIRLVGDSSKAHKVLKWNHTVDFESMVNIMMKNEIRILQRPDADIWVEEKR